MLEYLIHEDEPQFRPKVYKIQIKKFGLRKFVRVNTERKGHHGTQKRQKTYRDQILR